MSDMDILREKDPQKAEFLDQWMGKYQRHLDLSEPANQATFYEGMLEMARHVAASAGGAMMSIQVSTEGVSRLSVIVT